jgi:muramoyltetrapeptide carboxypeptidase
MPSRADEKALRVGFPFPSGRPDRGKVEAGLRLLQSRWRIDPVCPLLEQSERWECQPAYLGGSDEERAAELVAFWSDLDTTVLWCGRGGYGATRLLARLEAKLRPGRLGLTRMLGYSDITALFALVRCRSLPVLCVHSPVLTELPLHPRPELLADALYGIAHPLPVAHPHGAVADFSGPIWGGNLAVLASLCGTPWLPVVENGAIFLEDVDEAPYRLDRFLTQLYDSGFFQHVKRVFLGQLTRCGPAGAGLQVLRQRLDELGLELLGELPVGHEAQHLPLFLDRDYRFNPASGALDPMPARGLPEPALEWLSEQSLAAERPRS